MVIGELINSRFLINYKYILKSHNKVVSLNSNTQETTPITTQEKIILEIKNNPSISKKRII